MTYENTRSTNTNTPCPPSYSPASQRSRYSQPNLPTLTVPFYEHGHHYHHYPNNNNNNNNNKNNNNSLLNDDNYYYHHQHQNQQQHHQRHNHHQRYNHYQSSVTSPDGRIRMSQPTLNSSFFGINFVNAMKNTKLSYPSLRTSGDNSINLQIQSQRSSAPNDCSFGCNIQDSSNIHVVGSEYRRGSRLSQPDIRPLVHSTNQTGTRERLSQPTLVTGDYYPSRMQHQRLSQPCLLSTWSEKPLNLHSPIKQKRFTAAMPKISNRDRMSQLDFGGVTRLKYHKELTTCVSKVNRDRFSIPELETQNDLRLIAGTPKQRFSLDSQLNPEGNKSRRLLPIASSPISEHQTYSIARNHNNKEITCALDEELENIIVATATPIIQSTERQLLGPIFKITQPTVSSLTRERMSVPEIRNASLRRLLDSPMKQRHSITGNLRQSTACQNKNSPLYYHEMIQRKFSDNLKEPTKQILKISREKSPDQSEININVEPKPIQKHYSYIYDSKDEADEVIGKLGIALPKKKYLESNFNENEQVITTVIETEVPIILGSPKYNKKTHVYGSETPKWMKKCLESDISGKKIMLQNNQILRINQINQVGTIVEEKSSDNNNKNCDKKISHDKLIYDNSGINSSDNRRNIIQVLRNGNDEFKVKDTCVRVKSLENPGESRCMVTLESNWSKMNTCEQLNELDSDTDSGDSTSI